MLEVKVSPEGEIVGYASLFGGPADAVNDIVVPGAFAAGLSAALPRMLREHKGAEVGRWTAAEEDDIGLKVRGVVTDAATLADLRSGRLDGLSIGYVATKAHRDPAGRRVLAEVALSEISVVRRPASSRARVLSVKSSPAAGAAPNSESTMEDQNGAAPDTTAEETTETKAVDITAAVTAALAPVTARLESVERVLRRPGAAAQTETKTADDMAAFTRYLRYGPDALDLTERKSLRLANDEQAGYLAAPQFVTEIDKNITLFSPIRGVATVRQTTASEVQTLRRTTPAAAFWVGEEEDRTETEIKYGKNAYPVHELATFIDVSNQLLEDAAVDVAAEVALEFAEAFGSTEAGALVTGNGSKKPLGFMNDTGLSFTAGGHASAITADGLLSLYHDVKPAYRLNGTWALNSTTLSTIRKLKDGNGQYLVASAEGMAGAPVTTLLGRPVIECPDMDDIGANAFPIAFGDFRLGFVIYDRIALSIVRDPYTQATKGRTRFHGRRRIAAGVRRAEAIRRLKIST